jgi:hypothetical protein
MHGPINVKSPNNTSKWQMGFNSAFKGLMVLECVYCEVRSEYLRVTYTKFFLTGDLRSIPSQDMWDILCTKSHWTAITLFSSVSVILPMHDVRPLLMLLLSEGQKEEACKLSKKAIICEWRGRQGSRSSPLPSTMLVFWLVSQLSTVSVKRVLLPPLTFKNRASYI